MAINYGAAARPLAQAVSPGFFAFNGGPYVAATHADGTYLEPPNLFPDATSAMPGETVVIYGNGFGTTSQAVARGSPVQPGARTTLPAIRIGGTQAAVQFAGLVSPGLFQFNVVVL